MAQIINNQKLISTSKTMLIILRILFLLLIVIAVIPWLAPTSKISEVLFGVYGIPHYTTKNFGEVVSNFTLLNRSLGFIGSIISLLPLFIGVLIMLRLSKNYASGSVFSIANAKSYSRLGIIYLLSAIILQPISQILFSLCATINNPVGQRSISITFDIANLTAIFFAIMLVVIGQVMKLGQKISEEQELTV